MLYNQSLHQPPSASTSRIINPNRCSPQTIHLPLQMEPGNFPVNAPYYYDSPFLKRPVFYRGSISRQLMQNEPQSFSALVKQVHGAVDNLPTSFVKGIVSADVVCPINLRRLPEEGSMVVLVLYTECETGEVKIKLFNSDGLMVGQLEQRACFTLASFLSDGTVMASKGYVHPLSTTWRQHGHSFVYRLRCKIHVGIRREDVMRVGRIVADKGVGVEFPSNPDITFWSHLKLQSGLSEIRRRDINAVFKLVESNASKRSTAIEPVDACKDLVRSEMFRHQREALGWLIHRENSNELPPFWEENGSGVYSDLLFGMRTIRRPDSLRGGIYADDTGLGKTLTMLALIAHDKCSSSVTDGNIKRARVSVTTSTCTSSRGNVSPHPGGFVISEVDEVSGRVKRKWSTYTDHEQSSATEGPPCRPTLVVCPPSVCSTWISQLANHTHPGSLTVHEYYGRNKASNAESLAQYDIVLTTYRTLGAELSSVSSPLRHVDWWRVILDEARVIKSLQSRAGRGLLTLKASRRWVVTGTPTQNKSHELYPLMAFLQLDPFTDEAFWRSMISSPVSKGELEGLNRLRVLMAAISLRRTREEAAVRLTSKSVETHFVELSLEASEVYNMVESEARVEFQSYLANGRVRSQYATLLLNILQLRQICDSPTVCTPSLLQDVSDEPDLQQKLAMDVEDSGFQCPICFNEQPSCVTITRCAHTFCLSCIMKAVRKFNSPGCPLCRHPITVSDLFTTSQSHYDDHHLSSSKIAIIVKLLTASRAEAPTRKSVVFSDFKKMLVILGRQLSQAGFKTLRIDGSSTQPANLITQFTNAQGPTILLANLNLCRAGIDLSAASRVYLVEPHLNPTVEDQATSRAHHIGQKCDVTIIRLVTRNTIEESIVELQKKKMKLRMAAFREGSPSIISSVVNNEDDKADVEHLCNLMWT